MTIFYQPFRRAAKRFLRAMCLACLALPLLAAAARAGEIWLAALPNMADLPGDVSNPALVSLHVGTFKLSTQYVVQASDDNLRQMLQALRRRGIALAVEGLALPASTRCGQGVEGYAAPGTMRLIAEKIKRLGGSLDAVAFDEPLWFGSHATGPRHCNDSVEAVARALAAPVGELVGVFPGMRIGDIEPVVDSGDVQWLDQLQAWPAAFRAATGRGLEFFHADIAWAERWQAPLRRSAGIMRDAGVAFGIIYNADTNPATAADWTETAARHADKIEAELGLHPEMAVFQSWTPQVTALLPVGRPGTLGWLVARYELPLPLLSAHAAGREISGQVLAAGNAPLAGAEIILSRGGDTLDHPVPERLSGLVPPGANQAMLLVRLNAECACNGQASLHLVDPVFAQRGHGAPRRPALPVGPQGSGGYTVTAAQKLAANGTPFDVTPGAAFDLALSIGSSPRAADTGYVALVFLDAQGHEKQRRVLWPGQERLELARTRTGADGGFALRAPAGDRQGLMLEVAPSATMRAAALALP